MLSNLYVCVCFLTFSKSEWIEITRTSKKGKTTQISEPPKAVTTQSYYSSETTPSYELPTERPTEHGISTFIPDLSVTSQHGDITTLEGARLGTNTMEGYFNSDVTTVKNIFEAFNASRRDDVEENEDDTTNFPNTTSNYNGFIPFMKTVQNSLVKNVRNTFKSKIDVLKNLRDNLLFEIQERMNSLWKPDELPQEARGGHDDDHYHMDFPSNEGALMTISFLTFAVYLIKLVLKLIHALKSKSQYYSTAMPPTAAGTFYVGRRKRDTHFDDGNKILQLIEEYNFL